MKTEMHLKEPYTNKGFIATDFNEENTIDDGDDTLDPSNEITACPAVHHDDNNNIFKISSLSQININNNTMRNASIQVDDLIDAKRRISSIDNNTIHRGSIIQSTWASLRGVVFTCVSSIFFSLTTVLVKEMSTLHPAFISCFRFLGILLFSIPMLSESKDNVFGPRHLRKFIFARGLFGATSLYLRYCSLFYLPIANATTIILSMPVFVCIFARIFLKEPFGLFHAISLAVTLLGITFTAKLDIIFGKTDKEAAALGIDRRSEIFGLSACMGATLIGAGTYVCVRKIRKVHNSIILFNFAWLAIIETTLITYVSDAFILPANKFDAWGLCALAILSFYAQWFLTKALQAEEAGIVSVTRASSEMICVFIFQIFLFKQIPDIYSLIGALLVSVSVILTGLRKWIANKSLDHPARKILAFTLK